MASATIKCVIGVLPGCRASQHNGVEGLSSRHGAPSTSIGPARGVSRAIADLRAGVGLRAMTLSAVKVDDDVDPVRRTIG
jgi:hypothetical protein